MLNWNALATSNTFCAETDFFKYTIKTVPNTRNLKYCCSLQVCGEKAIKIGGLKISIENAKAAAQEDYAARIAQGERIMKTGKYQK